MKALQINEYARLSIIKFFFKELKFEVENSYDLNIPDTIGVLLRKQIEE